MTSVLDPDVTLMLSLILATSQENILLYRALHKASLAYIPCKEKSELFLIMKQIISWGG